MKNKSFNVPIATTHAYGMTLLSPCLTITLCLNGKFQALQLNDFVKQAFVYSVEILYTFK